MAVTATGIGYVTVYLIEWFIDWHMRQLFLLQYVVHLT